MIVFADSGMLSSSQLNCGLFGRYGSLKSTALSAERDNPSKSSIFQSAVLKLIV